MSTLTSAPCRDFACAAYLANAHNSETNAYAADKAIEYFMQRFGTPADREQWEQWKGERDA